MDLKLHKPKALKWSSTPAPVSFWSMAWKCPTQAGYLTNTEIMSVALLGPLYIALLHPVRKLEFSYMSTFISTSLCSLKMGATTCAKSCQMPHDHVSLAPGLLWERKSELAQTWTWISVIPGLWVGEDTSHSQEHGDSKHSGRQTFERHTSIQQWGKLWKTLGKSSFELLTSPGS